MKGTRSVHARATAQVFAYIQNLSFTTDITLR